MAVERQDKAGRHKRGNADCSRPQRPPLPAHRLFAPLLGVWGAALGGLTTLVLPQPVLFSAAVALGLGALGGLAPFALAAIAALILGAAMLMLARLISRKTVRQADAPSLAAMAIRRVRTIDPVSDLGSNSLDEPVASQPFASHTPQAEPAPEAALHDLPPPRALDLGEFVALAGRNAVWVEEPAPGGAEAATCTSIPDAAPECDAAPAPLRAESSAAIERLRAVPPSELSMVQMVERFAAAMHEHQATALQNGQRADLAGRDAALAEALKALATLSVGSGEDPHNDPLRASISRLQELRGAA